MTARSGLRTLDEHRALVEQYLADLSLAEDLDGLKDAMRYSLDGGGKRIRPTLCLATGEAAGAEPEALLPAAAAVELVHTFSLIHDDLPALDDDALRRGRASAHVRFDEATAILAGDALLAEALRLAVGYGRPEVARELADATLGMIGGQYRELARNGEDVLALHRLKTGRLFAAAVGCALWVADVPETDQEPWRAFADDVGLLFQLVDDILDGDGYARLHGAEAARRAADEVASQAQSQLDAIQADTTVLAELVSALSTRAA